VACGFPRCSLNQSGSHALTGEECTEMHRGFLSQQHGLSFSVTSYEQRLSWQQSFEFGTNSCDCNRLKTNNLIIGLLPPRPLFLLRDPCAPHSCAFILLLLLPPPPSSCSSPILIEETRSSTATVLALVATVGDDAGPRSFIATRLRLAYPLRCRGHCIEYQ